jgi:3-oxoacyl-[acyl-carrier-protein] synthase-3
MATVYRHETTQRRLSARLTKLPVSENGRAQKSEPDVARRSSRTEREPLQTLQGVQILGVGSHLAEKVVTNEDLAGLGCDAKWIVKRTGIRERRHAPPHVSTGDLAYHAAKRCLEQSNTDPRDVDLLVLATTTPDHIMPSTACELQQRLDLTCGAMDINAACAGFMYALITAMQFVKCGSSRRALVVGSDTLSRLVNPTDKKIYPIFGDAAGAVVLGKGSPSQGLLSYCLGSDGSGVDLLCVPAGGSREPASVAAIEAGRTFLGMDGRPVFKWAVRIIADTTRDVLQQSGMTVDDLDLLVLHQANTRIIDAAAAELGIPREKVAANMERCGNTSAASIPLVLDELHQSGRIVPGSTVLLSGFGAGLTWGTGVFRW